jgi:Tfp pilus assembly protein PilO
MNRLPKEKRDKLILVIMASVTLLGLVYFGLVSPAHASINRIRTQTDNARDKFQTMQNTIKKADSARDELIDTLDKLSNAEQDIASGDTFAWTYDMLRGFKATYKNVDIPVIGQAAIGDVDFLPNFPYRQIKVTVSGTGYYHDIGKFIADFENTYPHMRIANISLEPSGATGDNSDRLSFKMDIIVLIKPNTP